MVDKLMCISNDDTQNYPFCGLQLVVEMFEPTNQKETTFPNPFVAHFGFFRDFKE